MQFRNEEGRQKSKSEKKKKKDTFNRSFSSQKLQWIALSGFNSRGMGNFQMSQVCR